MNEIKIQLPKNILIVIAVIIIAFALGGYMLYFSSQKRMEQKEREFDMLKEKQIHTEENYNELQKKFDGTSEDLKQVNKDYEAILQKHQECKEKSDNLQTQYEALMKSDDDLKKQLQDCQTKAGVKSEPTSATTPTTTNSTATPDTVTPTSTTSPQSALDSKTQLASYQCPTPDLVTKNASSGNWLQNKVTWWVDYSSRPLAEHEAVHDLFQVLYDGQTVACYYELKGDQSANTWLIVKGSSKNNTILMSENDGWSRCATQDCKMICEKQNLTRCHFTISQ